MRQAGKQLKDLRDGPHSEEGVEEWQVGLARERARERVEQLGKRLEELPEHPTWLRSNFGEHPFHALR